MRNIIKNIPREKYKELKKIMDIFDIQDEKVKKLYNRGNYEKEQKQKINEKKYGFSLMNLILAILWD